MSAPQDSVERIRRLFKQAVKKLFPWMLLLPSLFKKLLNSTSLSTTRPHVFAYNLMSGKTERLVPLFRDLDVNLRKSQLKISFRAYVSLTVFASVFAFVLLFASLPPLLASVLRLPIFASLLFGLGVAMLAGAFIVIAFYFYPTYRIESLKRSVEDTLPFSTSYMGILASAGVPPDKVFRSLAALDKNVLAVSTEAKTIVRDVDLFGYDFLSALKNASERTASGKFKELLEGFIATSHSGGNLATYLSDRSRLYMRLKHISLRKFSDVLSILAEFYVTFLVAGPLLLVVMLSVMAMLGGGGFGLLDPMLLLYLLTYLAIPVGSIVFLIILDAVSPRW